MRVRSVVVVGRDASFWLTVLALDRALKQAGISLKAIALPSDLQDGEAIAAAPSLSGLHRRLGLDDRQLVQAASGVRAGGQHLRGWGPSPFLLGFEDPVRMGEGVDLGQYWAVERLTGAAVSRDRLSPCAVAMANGRVAGDGGQRQFPIAAGFHLDAAAYALALEAEARRRGIDVRGAEHCAVEASGDRIDAIALADGERVTADLFVDVSGAEARLSGALPDDDWVSWSDRISTRSIRWTSAPPLMPRPPFSDLTRTAGGWEARVPLANRTALVSATGDDNGFDAGQRTAWRGNMVAIGDAACRPEPVDHLALHMTHVGIANLIAWFPSGDERLPERDRYNETVAMAGRHLLDFQACRHDSERARSASDALDQRLSLFDAIGSVPAFDEDPFDPSHWERYFAGLGRLPASASVAALALPTERRHAMLGALVADIDREVAALPTVLQDLAR